MNPKLSRNLTARTHLTPDQLIRARGQAGEGLASRYRKDGSQSLELTRRLAKARGRARRFVLYSDQLGRRVYVSADTRLDVPLTFEVKEALQFFEGFDEPRLKVQYWNQRTPLLKFKTTHA